MSARRTIVPWAVALGLGAVLAAAGSGLAAEPVYVGSIREGITAPVSLAADRDRIAILESYTRQIALYSSGGFEQHRLDIDAEARSLARLGPATYLFCEPGRGVVQAADLGSGTTRVFLANADEPVDVAVDGERCWVLDAGGRILVTNLAGRVEREIALVGTNGLGLAAPSSLARDPGRSRLHVLDQLTCRISSFDDDGTARGEFCSFGAEDGQVSRGGEIACDADGWVYVCDRYQGRVAVFSSEGDFVCNIDPLDLGAERLALPTGISVDDQGLIYVASTESRRVDLFYLDKDASSGWLPVVRLLRPGDRAGVACEDLRLVAAVAPPEDAPPPTGADFRVLHDGNAGERVAEATNVPVAPGGDDVGEGVLLAEWRPELDCVAGALYAWQARARTNEATGAWSALSWFVAEAPVAFFALGQNYPNPFTPRTVIPFHAPAGAEARLRVFDIQGRVVWEQHLVDLPGGIHEVTWDGRNGRSEPVASGVYFYRLDAGSFTAIRKLVLVR